MTGRRTNGATRRRRSLRLRGYDYRWHGAYFVTVCTRQRGRVLGEITRGTVRLNRLGRLVASSWADLPTHYRAVTLDDWIVMPDHVHGIIVLQPAVVPLATTVRTHRRLLPESIGSIVGSFKAAVSRQMSSQDAARYPRLWQRGYYERIIRDGHQLDAVRAYIRANPRRYGLRKPGMSIADAGGPGSDGPARR